MSSIMSQSKKTLLENQILAINNNSHNNADNIYTHTHTNLRILAYLQMILGFFKYFMLNNGRYIHLHICTHFETDHDIRLT